MKIKTQDDNSFQPLEENKHVYFSHIKGLEINLHDEANTITFKVSIYTGIEKVLINNQIFSKKRTFRRHTKHQFQFNGNEYVIEFKLNNLIKFTWTCTLFKNSVLLKKFECINTQNKQPFFKKHPEIIYGAFAGAAFASGYLSLYTVLLIVIIGTIFSISYMKRFLLVRESLLQSG